MSALHVGRVRVALGRSSDPRKAAQGHGHGPVALAAVGLFSPMLRELRETLYQWDRPSVSNAGRFQAALGPLEPTPLPQAVQATVAWFRAPG